MKKYVVIQYQIHIPLINIKRGDAGEKGGFLDLGVKESLSGKVTPEQSCGGSDVSQRELTIPS